jgi:preprotein translocase subunit SecY
LLLIDINFSIFFGGTSLLIMVAVVLDTIQQIKAHLAMHGYSTDNKSSRVKKEYKPI